MAVVVEEEKAGILPVADERKNWKCRNFIIGAGIVAIAVVIMISFVVPLASKNKQEQQQTINDIELPTSSSGPDFSSDNDSSNNLNSTNNTATTSPASTTTTKTEHPSSIPTSTKISSTMPTHEPSSQSFLSASPVETPFSPATNMPTKIPTPQPTLLLITSALPTIQGSTTTSPTQSSTSTTTSATTKPTIIPDTHTPTTEQTIIQQQESTNLPTPQPSTKSPTVEPTALSPPTTEPTTSSQPSAQPTFVTTIEGSYELLEVVPHDSAAFTQGLELIQPLSSSSSGGGGLSEQQQHYYESTGLYGQSTIRIVNLASGEVLMKYDLPGTYFGEGMTHFDNGKLIQITWKEQTAFIYNATTLEIIDILSSYTTTNGEGWGICYAAVSTESNESGRNNFENKGAFYVTDGTHYLHQWNSTSFEFLGKVPVHMIQKNDGNGVLLINTTIDSLNELEWDWHTQTVLSNVWYQDYLVRINPKTGFVTHRYDLETLYQRSRRSNVLNGIAVTDIPNEIWVTGKRWPNMYRIRLIY